MTRRTRRNLSDRRIKKIIKRNLEGKEALPADLTPQTSIHFGKWVLWAVLVVVLGLVIYLGVSRISWETLFVSRETVRNPGPQKKPAEAIQEGQEKKQAPSAPSGETASAAKEKTTETRTVVNPVPQKTQVEILNGCGVSGIAKRATRFCRQNDLDVVAMDNFKHFNVQYSYVIDWMGNKKKAQEIARLLGIDPRRVKTQIDPTKQLDATIVLGKDYQQLKPFKK